jgi:excisionase family DNA binding protein
MNKGFMRSWPGCFFLEHYYSPGYARPKERTSAMMTVQSAQNSPLLTFKEAMNYLRVSRSTLYRLMWSGQLTGHKVGSTWRFYQAELQASVRTPSTQTVVQEHSVSDDADQAKILVAASHS